MRKDQKKLGKKKAAQKRREVLLLKAIKIPYFPSKLLNRGISRKLQGKSSQSLVTTTSVLEGLSQ